MPRLSLSDTVDIISKAGSPKATKVSQVKNRDQYQPFSDFYKRLKSGIIDIHEAGGTKSALDNIATSQTDSKKRSVYPVVIKGYKKWWGSKQLGWYAPFSQTYTQHGVDVRVNPDLGLYINGVPHLIKLYLKDEKLMKARVDVITALMETALGAQAQPGTVMAVIDVRNGKMFTGTGVPATTQRMMNMVDAELAYVASIWPFL